MSGTVGALAGFRKSSSPNLWPRRLSKGVEQEDGFASCQAKFSPGEGDFYPVDHIFAAGLHAAAGEGDRGNPALALHMKGDVWPSRAAAAGDFDNNVF